MLFDVFRELFKMFVADLRLTLTRLAGVALVALSLDTASVAAMTADILLTGSYASQS
jgi:hypothetical protein